MSNKASPPSTLFHLANESLHYGEHRVLDNISLNICCGEKVALLGPSGAGKTTLLNLLHRQQPQSSALQPQGGGLVDLLSVYHNIFIGGLDRVGTFASLWNLLRPLAKQRKQIADLVSVLGLDEKLWQSADQLSGGQRQRVAVGRALFRQQPIFLGDEPVSALDPLQAESLLVHVLEKHQTAVVSLHNRRLALAHFDRIIVLRNGRVCCDCAATDLSLELLEEYYQQQSSPVGENNLVAPNPWVALPS